MTRWGLVIDVNKCNACYNCFVACKDEFWNNEYPPYSKPQPKLGQYWVRLEKKERGQFPFITVAYMPVMCMHCENAPCIEACPPMAIYRREDGVVIIDPGKCNTNKCNKECISSCPYGTIFVNEELKIAQKCTLCAHRLEKGKLPRCIEACPTGAMVFGDLDDPDSDIFKLLKSGGKPVYLDSMKVTYSGRPKPYEPKPGVKPSVFYVGLHMMTKLFIAGSVVLKDTDDLVEGAVVRLYSNEKELANSGTDAFGQFMFEGLNPGSYRVQIEYPGYRRLTVDVSVEESRYLGYLFLEKE